MATIVFEDKLSDYLSLAEKASHGYYISNGVYHQNLEKVDVNAFAKAVKTIKKMFEVAFEYQSILMKEHDKPFAHEAFWNNLKRQQKRFNSIGESLLDIDSNEQNVSEIIQEHNAGNQQVITQFKNAVTFNLTELPIIFFNILEDNAKANHFEHLQARLIEMFHKNYPTIQLSKANLLQQDVVCDSEILSWFTTKDTLVAQQKQEFARTFKNDQEQIEKEKQQAIDEANKQATLAAEQAKKAQEEALKMMAELQKKHGLT